MPYTTPADIREAAYGIAIPEGEDVDAALAKLIAKAERRLIGRVPSIPGRIIAGTLDVDRVKDAVEDIVLRVVRNPNGYSSEQAGEFSYRIDRVTASGRIEVTPDDLVGLLPSRPVAARSIRLGLPKWRLP